MKIEDALLYVVLESTGQLQQAVEAAEAAVAGGADVIEMPCARAGGLQVEQAVAVAQACRTVDALLMLRGGPEDAAEAGADGVLLDGGDLEVGYARTVAGDGSLVGVAASEPKSAQLALELEPDFLIYEGGAESAAGFAGFRGLSSAVLFAGGIRSLEEAERVVGVGVYRLAVRAARTVNEGLTDEVAHFARLLGRCI